MVVKFRYCKGITEFTLDNKYELYLAIHKAPEDIPKDFIEALEDSDVLEALSDAEFKLSYSLVQNPARKEDLRYQTLFICKVLITEYAFEELKVQDNPDLRIKLLTVAKVLNKEFRGLSTIPIINP